MAILRLAPLALLLGLSTQSVPAQADVAYPEENEDSGGSDTGQDDEDGGCATATAAAGSIGALGLGLGLVIGLRRRS